MALFERILCAVDFDGNSITALRMAKRIAQREEGTLWVVHVVPPVDPLVISAPLLSRRKEDEARAELARLAREELPAVQHQTMLLFGQPADEIVNAAGETKADLIVLATHGRRGVAHMILGSVAEKVVREANCPVLTVRIGPDGSAA